MHFSLKIQHRVSPNFSFSLTFPKNILPWLSLTTQVPTFCSFPWPVGTLHLVTACVWRSVTKWPSYCYWCFLLLFNVWSGMVLALPWLPLRSRDSYKIIYLTYNIRSAATLRQFPYRHSFFHFKPFLFDPKFFRSYSMLGQVHKSDGVTFWVM